MDYLRVGLVIAPQLVAGCLIYLLILRRNEVALSELVSLGGVLGIGLSTIFDQVFVNIGLPNIGWSVFAFVTLILFYSIKKSGKITFAKLIWRDELTRDLLPIAAIAAMALGTDWYWLLPPAVFLVLAAFFLIVNMPQYRRLLVFTSFVCFVVSYVIMILNRPKIWWMMYESDYPLLQAISRSVADRGIDDLVILSGTPHKYYWFTYAWIGLVDRSSNSPTFFVLTQVAPAIFGLLITGTVWSLIRIYSISRLRTFAMTLVIMTASSYPLWNGGMKIALLASPSQFYAFAFLFATVFLLLQASHQLIRNELIILALLSAMTILSKAMHGLILIFAITLVLVARLVSKAQVSKSMVLNFVAIIFASLTSYFLFIANPLANSLSEIRFGDYIWQLQGDAKLLPEKYVDLIGFFTTISFTVIPVLLVVANFSRTKFIENKLLQLLNIGSITAGSTLALLILGYFGENLYFLHAAVHLSTLLGFTLLANYKKLLDINLRTTLVLALTGISLALISYLIPNINSGAQYAIIIRSMRVYTSPLIIFIAAAVILGIGALRHKPSFDNIVKLVVVASTMVVTFSVINWIDTMPRKHNEYTRDGASYLANTDLQDLANWMNTNTDKEDIVASNFGWPKILPGEFESFSAQCPALRNKDVIIGNCKRSTSALLVAYMHRQTWIQFTGVLAVEFTPELEERQTATLGFSSNPTSSHLELMLDDGVDWFVIDRSTVDRTSWQPFAITRYSNDSFFVLEV